MFQLRVRRSGPRDMHMVTESWLPGEQSEDDGRAPDSRSNTFDYDVKLWGLEMHISFVYMQKCRTPEQSEHLS